MVNEMNSAIMSPKTEGDEEMSDWTILQCSECKPEKPYSADIWLMCRGQASIKGIMTCTRCGKERPFYMINNCLQHIDIGLPDEQSRNLAPEVSDDIKEDIREAERANFAQCYKASVAMCRRALQLGLIDKGIKDDWLSKMLKDALQQTLLTQDTFNLATSIKGYGDIGVHRREVLEPQEVGMVIYMAVRMLNELFS